MKFKAPEIGVNKAVEVKQSNKNMRLFLTLQLDLAKTADLSDQIAEASEDEAQDKVMAQFKQALHSSNLTIEFITELLKLNKSQTEKLEDLDIESTNNLANRLGMRLQGMSEKQVADIFSNNSEDDDSKKSAPAKESSN